MGRFLNYCFDGKKSRNALNLKKHKIAFEEAKSVFSDEFGLLLDEFVFKPVRSLSLLS